MKPYQKLKDCFAQGLRVLCLALCWPVGHGGFASAQTLVANFESWTEGEMRYVFTDGGITFSNLNDHDPYGPVPFTVETVSIVWPNFSPPNYLSFGGTYSPGPGGGFGKMASADILFPGLASHASLDVLQFGFSLTPNNKLSLQAFRSGGLVATDTIGATGEHLAVSGSFDSLRLIVSGFENNGTMLFGIDNVRITLVPEPTIAALVLGGVLSLRGRRWLRRDRSASVTSGKSNGGADRVRAGLRADRA